MATNNTTLTAGRATAVVAFEKVTLLMTHALLGHYAELQKHWMDKDAEILQSLPRGSCAERVREY